MPNKKRNPTGITNAPLKRERRERELVPRRGKSTIGKGRNRKPQSPAKRRKTGSR